MRHAVVQKNLEASGECDDHFLKFPIGMATAGFPARYVINPIYAGNTEGDMAIFLHKGKIPPIIKDLGKLNNGSVINRTG